MCESVDCEARGICSDVKFLLFVNLCCMSVMCGVYYDSENSHAELALLCFRSNAFLKGILFSYSKEKNQRKD